MAPGSRSQRNDFLRLSLTLFAITAIVAMLLSIAQFLTAPIVKQKEQERLNAALQSLLSGASSFTVLENMPASVTVNGTSVPVGTVYVARDAAGNVVGHCIQVNPSGYSNAINMVVAVNSSGAVSGVQILSMSDTPGIGMKALTDEALQKSVLGLTQPAAIVKGKTAGKGEAQVISGATISSSAYINGVNAALDVAADLQ